jgi:hypothetical protein
VGEVHRSGQSTQRYGQSVKSDLRARMEPWNRSRLVTFEWLATVEMHAIFVETLEATMEPTFNLTSNQL